MGAGKSKARGVEQMKKLIGKGKRGRRGEQGG